MEASEGFPPVARRDARVLVLGSLPGQRSLSDQEYYAHPQNVFWRIMRELFSVSGDYDQRCTLLSENEIALWDVLRKSVRPGSMDAAIRKDSAIVNDFSAFLGEFVQIEQIVFNGKKAEQLFLAMVPKTLWQHLQLTGLPSTSPAYAAMSFAGKLDAWETGLRVVHSNN
jgi:TDG/mug DNA glycosylase family protein